jgi:hypothetical protein
LREKKLYKAVQLLYKIKSYRGKKMKVKKCWKRWCLALLTLCFMCTAIGITALADNEQGALVTALAQVDNGQVTLTLTIPENSGVAGGKIGFDYDTNQLELVSFQYEDFSGAFVVSNTNKAGRVVVSIAATQEIVSGGSLIAVFDLKTDTFDNSYIEFTDYQLGNENGEKIEELETVKTINITLECNHTSGTWTVAKEAGKTEEGLKELHCDICGEVIQTEIIPMLKSESEETTVEDRTQSETIQVYETKTDSVDNDAEDTGDRGHSGCIVLLLGAISFVMFFMVKKYKADL